MKKLFVYFYDEIDFKQVFKNPKRWVGYSFILFFFVIFALGIVYLDQIDQFYKNPIPYFEPDSAKLFKDVNLSLGRKVEGVKIEYIKNPTEAMLKRGEEIFRTTCSTCHGESGKGDGIAGKGLNPPPRDFTKKDGWKNGTSIAQIYKTLQEGIPGTGMVSYEFLSPSEKIALFYIIKSFSNEKSEVSDKDIAELEANYKVTQTYELPPTIPIGIAMSKIVNESQEVQTKANSISNLLNDNYIMQFIEDKEKFSAFLVNAKRTPNELEQLLIQNYPLNGVSSKFILATNQEKQLFIEKIKLMSINTN
ncbi:MAG: cytochrome c [Ignavibacteria bacterium]|nr:cytochrome c [Ignavibacteria bacterium]